MLKTLLEQILFSSFHLEHITAYGSYGECGWMDKIRKRPDLNEVWSSSSHPRAAGQEGALRPKMLPHPAVKLETLRPENNGLEGVVQRRDMGPSKTNQTNHADESRSPKNTYRHSFSMEFLSILAQIKNHQTPSILSNVLETSGNKQGVLDNPV